MTRFSIIQRWNDVVSLFLCACKHLPSQTVQLTTLNNSCGRLSALSFSFYRGHYILYQGAFKSSVEGTSIDFLFQRRIVHRLIFPFIRFPYRVSMEHYQCQSCALKI